MRIIFSFSWAFWPASSLAFSSAFSSLALLSFSWAFRICILAFYFLLLYPPFLAFDFDFFFLNIGISTFLAGPPRRNELTRAIAHWCDDIPFLDPEDAYAAKPRLYTFLSCPAVNLDLAAFFLSLSATLTFFRVLGFFRLEAFFGTLFLLHFATNSKCRLFIASFV